MPTSRFPVPYSAFIADNFRFVNHICTTICNCSNLGCRSHYTYKDDLTPNLEQMRHMLATWQAFRVRNRNGIYLIDTWTKHFDLVADMVRPMSNLTLLCNWEHYERALATAFDRIKAIVFDSVVCTTKTLHCLVPDLFLILDRRYAYEPWRQYLLGVGAHTLPAPVGSVDGARYISLMKSVRAGLYYSISNNWPLVLGQTRISVSSALALRHISPIKPGGQPPDIPNTIGKVLDNIVAGSPFEA